MPRSMTFDIDVELPAAKMYNLFTKVDYWQDLVGFYRENAARTEIERLDLKSITCADAVTALARILHAAHEGDKPFELEMAWVCDASGRKFGRVPADLVAAADAAARAALDASDMEDA